MTLLSIILATTLLGTAALGMTRIFRGPTRTDAMLAVLLLGTTGTGMALLLGTALAMPGALDVALIFALLAAIIGVAFVLRGWTDHDRMNQKEEE